MIADAAIRKTYLAHKEITETVQQVVAVKKALDYLAKSLKDSGEYFKKFNILSVVTSIVALMEDYSLSEKHKAIGDLLWEIEKKRKKNDELKPGDPARNPILTKLSETARSDRTDHLEWRKDFYTAQFIQLGLTPIDPKRRFSDLERGILVRLQEGQCKKCKCKITAETGQVDHIKPYSKGGMTILENAQLLCESCNKRKGAKE
jgi:5-methylcytosine-specific restriction endonuclease McrA